MPGQPLRLGPFIGGINNHGDTTAIGDAELVDCVNFELDLDGALLSRPPIQTTIDMASTWTERIVMIGVGVFEGTQYLMGSNVDGIFAFNVGSSTWSTLTTTFQASSMVQYNDFVYFLSVPDATDSLSRWSPGGGWSAVSPANLHTMMGGDRGGGALVIFKERLFIIPGLDKAFNPSRLIFSDAGLPETYTTTTQFIDIHPGDGQKLIDAVSHDDNLMLFKEDSTFVMSYSSRPADAEILNINTTIGATIRHCVVTYENSLFVYHEGKVYEIVNYDFQQINTKVPFVYDATAPDTRREEVFMSIMGDRLIVRYYNRIYVFGLKTRTWSRWESEDEQLHNFGPIVAIPANVTADINNLFYAGSGLIGNDKVYLIKDGFSSDDREVSDGVNKTIYASIQTKNYDLANPYQYKKLYWWGADVGANTDVVGTVTPIAFGFIPQWETLVIRSWGSLVTVTWGDFNTNTPIETTVSAAGSGNVRRFIKFPRTLRYRQVIFELQLSCTGNTSDSPVKLFSLIAITATKEILSKAIT